MEFRVYSIERNLLYFHIQSECKNIRDNYVEYCDTPQNNVMNLNNGMDALQHAQNIYLNYIILL